jgi:hypothetical protein
VTHHQALEGIQTMHMQDVVIKQTEPVRAIGTAPALGTENRSAVFVPLFSQVLAYLKSVGARPGISIAHYEKLTDDGSVVLHVGFDLGTQAVVGTNMGPRPRAVPRVA